MDLSPVARKVMKLALKHMTSRDPFFEIMWREMMVARDREWLDDDRAQLIASMMAEHKASSAQLLQDIWVLFETGHKKGGFFVEFGATNGIELSNSYLLESAYDWRGILSEPNPGWHDALHRNRPNATISTDCVWSASGEMLSFLATGDKEFGTISDFATHDRYGKVRENHEKIAVRSVTLNDLLEINQAPRDIDFISIDTEGSELRILEAFDFGRWNVSLFCVEHNYTPNEARIIELMNRQGYERRFPAFSRYDAWFRKRSSAGEGKGRG